MTADKQHRLKQRVRSERIGIAPKI